MNGFFRFQNFLVNCQEFGCINAWVQLYCYKCCLVSFSVLSIEKKTRSLYSSTRAHAGVMLTVEQLWYGDEWQYVALSLIDPEEQCMISHGSEWIACNAIISVPSSHYTVVSSAQRLTVTAVCSALLATKIVAGFQWHLQVKNLTPPPFFVNTGRVHTLACMVFS